MQKTFKKMFTCKKGDIINKKGKKCQILNLTDKRIIIIINCICNKITFIVGKEYYHR